MRVIARALFGQELAQADLDWVSDVMAFTMDYLMTGAMTSSFPRWLPIPGARRYHAELREIDALIGQIIAHERSAKTPQTACWGCWCG